MAQNQPFLREGEIGYINFSVGQLKHILSTTKEQKANSTSSENEFRAKVKNKYTGWLGLRIKVTIFVTPKTGCICIRYFHLKPEGKAAWWRHEHDTGLPTHTHIYFSDQCWNLCIVAWCGINNSQIIPNCFTKQNRKVHCSMQFVVIKTKSGVRSAYIIYCRNGET